MAKVSFRVGAVKLRRLAGNRPGERL